MEFKSHPARRVIRALLFTALVVLVSYDALAQSNVNVRVMAANLNGNSQKYEPFALRIFQGLKPDVVCIQEFNYTSTNGVDANNPAAIREMVDLGFGTNFFYYREPISGIPNGIISRYPMINSGYWVDTLVSNRGFAWAQIDLPGTNDLYVVSVHLLTTSAGNRAAEAANLKALMQANFPANAWIVLAGDFNADPRTEACITTFNGYLTDSPIPVDQSGDSDTSAGRSTPHDYVLPSLTFTNFETATVLPSHSFPSGLVFDSRVYTPLTDVPPVLIADSGNAQHMAVMKDFLIPVGISTNPPSFITQASSQTNFVGLNTSFSVTATGASPLSYQWFFGDTNIPGATGNAFTINNVQATNAGNYFVIVTNLYGSATSSVAVLTVNLSPYIVTQPHSQTINVSNSATFSAVAGGEAPLNYQWLFNGTNISGATTNFFSITNAQLTDAGNYSLLVANLSGSVTSSIAVLSVLTTQAVVIAQWNFNSAVADTNVGSGTILPSTGSGTAALMGGTSATFATGDTTFDPAGNTDNSGWNIASYPAATASNKTAGVKFKVSTLGKTNILITWSQRASNTGSKYARLRYSTDGINFVDFPTSVSLSAGAVFEVKTNSLVGFAGVDDNTNFTFQIVSEFQSTATGSGSTAYVAANTGSAYAGGSGGGTTRFDMVTVTGVFIDTSSTPPSAPTLSTPIFTSGQLQFLLTGTTGATYIIQSATNLMDNNWVPQITNVSPFTFTDLDLTTPQKFYRATPAQP